MFYTKYPNSGIILGADCNGMDITPILKCGLKLRQVVDQKTHGKKIIDILIMNTASFYKSPIIAPPIKPDNPLKAKASDHFVPVCFPHLNRYERPIRNHKIIQFRPLPRLFCRHILKRILVISVPDGQSQGGPKDSFPHRLLSFLLSIKYTYICFIFEFS